MGPHLKLIVCEKGLIQQVELSSANYPWECVNLRGCQVLPSLNEAFLSLVEN